MISSLIFSRRTRVLLIASTLALVACNSSQAGTPAVAAPAVDLPLATNPGKASIVVSGGCFWGVQAVFQHVKGVISATSGYAGGKSDTAHYEMVSDGNTGHAESVQVIYDPSQISLGQLLRVFFSVAHNPTELNRQGPDSGTQYRSAIWFSNADQQHIASTYIKQLNAGKAFSDPIVTQLSPLPAFYAAEDYHQDYARLHPNDMYIAINDRPKVTHLQEQFPKLYIEPR